jgi:hypothetical protein
VEIADAQREVREVYRNGAIGGFVSGALWLASAAAGTWGSKNLAVLVLIFGGFFIFPMTQLGLKLTGGRASLSDGNPLRYLAMQVAFVVPLCIPLILAATHEHATWFYPGFMIVVGAHYLPFIFLYGMPAFAGLGGLLVGLGWLLGLHPRGFTLGGWITGGLFVLFGLLATRLGPRARA